MAGTKGRSGRRQIASVPAGFSLPSLGDSEESVLAYTEALARAVSAGPDNGGIDPRVGDTLQKVAATHLRALTQRAGRSNMLEEFRKQEAELERLKRVGRLNEEADRQHARTGDDDGPAVWDEEPTEH